MVSRVQHLLLVLILCSPIGAWAVEGELLISVPNQPPAHLSVAQISSLPSKSVLVNDEAGNPAHYRGVRVADVLAKADLALPALRGKLMTRTLLVSAADGYAVVFALPEVDPNFTDKDVLICFEKEGAALNEKEGPMRIVVPDDKRHARWVRRVTQLTVQPGLEEGK